MIKPSDRSFRPDFAVRTGLRRCFPLRSGNGFGPARDQTIRMIAAFRVAVKTPALNFPPWGLVKEPTRGRITEIQEPATSLIPQGNSGQPA